MSAPPAARLRVALVNNQGLASSGGGVTILRHLVADLCRDHDVTLYSFDPPAGDAGAREVRLRAPPPARGVAWRLAPLLRARHLRRELRACMAPADLVICLDCHFAHALAGCAAPIVYISLSCIPRQEWFASKETPSVSLFLQNAYLERKLIRAARAVVVASRTHARELRRFELLPNLAAHVLWPVFPASAPPEPAPSAPRIAAARPILICVGRLAPVKNVGALVLLADRLRDLDFRLLIVGDGEEVSFIKEEIRRLALEDRVSLLGERHDVAALMGEADLLLHPSHYESFGIAVFEAMRAGVAPVLGTRRGVNGYAEFITDGRNGFVVDFDDIDAAARRCRGILGDAALRERVGREAGATARRMLEQDYVGRFRALIATVAPAAQRPRHLDPQAG